MGSTVSNRVGCQGAATSSEARVALTFKVDENGMRSVSHPGGVIYKAA